MRYYNITENHEKELGQFVDDRGSIKDILYAQAINHASIITCAPGAIRGNHYHKLTTQYVFVVNGSMDYFCQRVDSIDKPVVLAVQSGDVVISEPNEIHALKAGNEGCTFIEMEEGTRSSNDFNSDVYKVKSIIS
jgi:dTDP-4-dehydrorhamnose 3,5-epimerase-like enzyme